MVGSRIAEIEHIFVYQSAFTYCTYLNMIDLIHMAKFSCKCNFYLFVLLLSADGFANLDSQVDRCSTADNEGIVAVCRSQK